MNNRHPMSERERNIRMKQQSLRRQGLPVTNDGARDLKKTLDHALPNGLQPGNLGALNRIIWPYWFTFTAPEMTPNSSSQGFTTITQEAAFVWMAYTKSIFSLSGGVYTYVDPENFGAAGEANGLKMSIRDAQSSRSFHNLPLELDMVGHPQFPSVLPTPMLLLPNSTMEITYQNDDAAVTYVPFITMFGYRIRIEDAQNLLSTVVG